MSALVRQEKVVSKPPDPDQVVADTLYYVRVGNGFDLYLSDKTGKLLFKLNGATPPTNDKISDYLRGRQKHEQNV